MGREGIALYGPADTALLGDSNSPEEVLTTDIVLTNRTGLILPDPASRRISSVPITFGVRIAE